MGSYYSWHKKHRWGVTPEGFLAYLYKKNRKKCLREVTICSLLNTLNVVALMQSSYPPSPFCSPEPSYETVSPMLCPPLENCSLSGNDCPYGFQQDKNGCLLCQCLSSKFTFLTWCWTQRAKVSGAVLPKHEHDTFLLTCCFLQFCVEMLDIQHWIYMFAHADVKLIW